MENFVFIAILLPMLSVLGSYVFRHYPNIRDLSTTVISVLLFSVVVKIFQTTNLDVPVEYELVELFNGISIAFHLEKLGVFFALIASGLWCVTHIYTIGYLRSNQLKNQSRFYAYFALSISITMAIAFSANLLTLFLFYELLTLSTYPLVTHSRTEDARKNGRIYLGVLLGTSICFQLTAILFIWSITKDLSFNKPGVFSETVSADTIQWLYILFLFGVGKAALIPFHRWLPAAMVAPAPVSALLHAVAVVKAGVFSVLKVTVYIFGLDTLKLGELSDWFFIIPSITIIIASLIALQQDNLKRLLAYSTVSQLSYIILATVILTPVSVIAATLHILAHALGKITLFFVAGSVFTATKITNVSQLNGIGRSMPLTMAAFFIGSLSMIGIPPALGFISKWYLIQSSVEIESWGITCVIIISTLLNAAYFLPITYRAFFTTGDIHTGQTHENNYFILLPILVTAGLTLLLFLLPDMILDNFTWF